MLDLLPRGPTKPPSSPLPHGHIPPTWVGRVLPLNPNLFDFMGKAHGKVREAPSALCRPAFSILGGTGLSPEEVSRGGAEPSWRQRGRGCGGQERGSGRMARHRHLEGINAYPRPRLVSRKNKAGEEKTEQQNGASGKRHSCSPARGRRGLRSSARPWSKAAPCTRLIPSRVFFPSPFCL